MPGGGADKLPPAENQMLFWSPRHLATDQHVGHTQFLLMICLLAACPPPWFGLNPCRGPAVVGVVPQQRGAKDQL